MLLNRTESDLNPGSSSFADASPPRQSISCEDLERNGVSDVDTIYALIYGGKNKMPGYGEQCTPKGQCTFGPRLADDDVRDLAQYVLDQSKAGWK